jgi:hypothetical protein
LDDPSASLTPAEKFDLTWCTGYVRGLLDAYTDWEAVDMNEKQKVTNRPCLPHDVGLSAGQGIRIIVKYLKDNPANLHQPAMVLGGVALRQAFPCGK